ncbi:hypothetical protein CUMW_224530 [Citrus unshiu]|nr:hypothetical protein CUMW_224530 [Citrus unshiu]GAY63314.1 hypothetical protein CUMW_224530 [Citrus unshiu]
MDPVGCNGDTVSPLRRSFLLIRGPATVQRKKIKLKEILKPVAARDRLVVACGLAFRENRVG